MKKILIAGILLIAILMIAGCEKSMRQSAKESKDTFENLLKQSSSLHCTHEMKDGASYLEYEAYISGNKYKTITRFPYEGGEAANYFINDGEYVYFWQSISSNAMKLDAYPYEKSITTAEGHPLNLARTNPSGCKPWTPDEEYFKLPAGINIQGE